MKLEAVKTALINLDKNAKIFDLDNSEFITGGAITNACRAAGYEESGRVVINQMEAWSMTVGELEAILCDEEMLCNEDT